MFDGLLTITAALIIVATATVGCWKRLYRAWMMEDRRDG